MREDALASVRRAYRIAGRDHGTPHRTPISSFPPPFQRDPSRSRSPSSPSRRRRRFRGLRPRARGPPSPLRRGVRALPPTGSLPGSRRPHAADLAAVDPETGAHGRHPGVRRSNAPRAPPRRARAPPSPALPVDTRRPKRARPRRAALRVRRPILLLVDVRRRAWGRRGPRGGDLPARGIDSDRPYRPRHPRGVLRGVHENPSASRGRSSRTEACVGSRAARRQTRERRVLRLRGRGPGGDAAARAAAARTAELEAQRDLYRGERISSAEKVNVAGRASASTGSARSGRANFRFSVAERLRWRTFRFWFGS